MKLIWAHDHYFIFDTLTKEYYSEIEFGYDIWERYLYSFDNILVIARVIEREVTEAEKRKFNLSSGKKVEFLHLPNINNIEQKIKKSLFVKKEIMQAVKNADAIVSRLPSQIGMMVLDSAEKHGKPSAIELVGCPDEALGNLKNFKAKLYRPYMVKKTKKLVEKSPYTLYVTKKYLQKKYPSFGKTIACSNVVLEKNNYEKVEFQRINEKNIVKIGLIGYLSEYKGIDTAFNICMQLDKSDIKFKLEILGGGNREKWVEKAKNSGIDLSKVKFLTLPRGEAVLNWLKNIDIYIQPSRTEGLPRGLIEAMSVGRIAVGSNVGGIPELLSRENVFDKEDYYSMSERIIEIVRDLELQREISLKNIEVANEYSFSNLDTKRKEFWKNFHDEARLTRGRG